MLGVDEVAEKSPGRVPERWYLVAVVTVDVAEQSSSLDVASSCCEKDLFWYRGVSM